MPSSRDLTVQRAWGRCEAMVRVNGTYTRCGTQAPDVHHMLTRSRGGDVLDGTLETYHLINLCRTHHNWIHMNPAEAEAAGLSIEGQVWVAGGRVIYQGPDDYLLATYGKDVPDEVWRAGESRRHQQASA